MDIQILPFKRFWLLHNISLRLLSIVYYVHENVSQWAVHYNLLYIAE